jgi:hypothetical protein
MVWRVIIIVYGGWLSFRSQVCRSQGRVVTMFSFGNTCSINAAKHNSSSWQVHPTGTWCWTLHAVKRPRLFILCWCNITWPSSPTHLGLWCPGHLVAPCFLLLSSSWVHLQHSKFRIAAFPVSRSLAPPLVFEFLEVIPWGRWPHLHGLVFFSSSLFRLACLRKWNVSIILFSLFQFLDRKVGAEAALSALWKHHN